MFQIIPAIDLMDGQCVRLSQGDYAKKTVYHSQPEEVAKAFEGAGIQRLHLVDLDGAKAHEPQNLKVLERIAKSTSLSIDFGGGVKSTASMQRVMDAGAQQVTAGSIAVSKPELVMEFLQSYGPERIILGADVKEERIAIGAWQESSSQLIWDFLSDYINKGIRYTISTDVAKDGLLQGPNMDLYARMQEKYPELHVIASGGVSNMTDLQDLRSLNLYGVIVGKAFYEGRISLDAMAQFNAGLC